MSTTCYVWNYSLKWGVRLHYAFSLPINWLANLLPRFAHFEKDCLNIHQKAYSKCTLAETWKLIFGSEHPLTQGWSHRRRNAWGWFSLGETLLWDKEPLVFVPCSPLPEDMFGSLKKFCDMFRQCRYLSRGAFRSCRGPNHLLQILGPHAIYNTK